MLFIRCDFGNSLAEAVIIHFLFLQSSSSFPRAAKTQNMSDNRQDAQRELHTQVEANIEDSLGVRLSPLAHSH